MAMRRIESNWGAGDSFLKSVPYIRASITPDNISKAAPKDQKEFAKLLSEAISQGFANSAEYIRQTDSTVVNVILGQIASLLDEVKATFFAPELQAIKDEVISAIKSTPGSESDKSELEAKLSELFSNVATKDDLDDLKTWLASNTNASHDEIENIGDDLESIVETEESEGETQGEYKDATVAANFNILQSFIQKQVDILNENLKKIPGQSGISSMFDTLGSIASGVANVGKFIGSGVIKGIASTVAGISTGVGAAIAGVSFVTKGIKSIGSGIKSGLGKIGKGIAAPFKKVGSMFSSLNPFKKRDAERNSKNESKKQAIRDKIMGVIAKVVDKIWKIVEPFIDKAIFFIEKIVMTEVVIPIAIIVAKVLLVTAAIIALGIGLYLVYSWVKKKIMQFVDYVVSGRLWADIKAKIVAAWEWMKDFGGWLWRKFVSFGKWLFVDMPLAVLDALFVKFPLWVWEQLCKFGNWLYDTYIDPYIIQPLTKLIQPIANLWVEKIQPKIQPFIDSLLKLKDMVVGIFKGWDTNKSFWENLKNMASLIKQGVLDWWNESPFKAFYEKHIEPFVISACELFLKLSDLGGFIKKAILDWWNGDSSLSETLKNIGTTLMNAVSEWWETSVFKKAYDEHIAPLVEKLKVYVSDLIKPIREWYEKSWLKKTIDTISGIINKVWNKLNVGEKLKKAWDGAKKIGGKVLGWFGKKPQNNITNINTNKTSIQTIKNIEQSTNTSTTIQAQQITQQQMSQAMKPIQSIDNMKSQNGVELQKTGDAVATEVATEKKQDKVYKDHTNAMLQNLSKGMDALHGDVVKYGQDPTVVSMPVPMRQQSRNSAMMGEN